MISIVMAYSNRKQLLIRTLDSISKSSIQDFEIIIVDDGSRDEHRIEDICNNEKIHLIRVEPHEKTWLNPCVVYNMALKRCSGDIVIIQNPECYHHGDILKIAAEKVKRYNYLIFPVYSLNQQETEDKFDDIIAMTYESLNDYLLPKYAHINGESGWYEHEKYIARGFHFCTAIHRTSIINDLGGFDNRYAHGLAFDDDDLIYRIKTKGYKIQYANDVVVFHQWHYGYHILQNPQFHELFGRNAGLLHNIQSGALPMWTGADFENI